MSRLCKQLEWAHVDIALDVAGPAWDEKHIIFFRVYGVFLRVKRVELFIG